MKIKQAVILCGGRGERLRPLTDSMPKPMINVNGKPFLYYLLYQLSKKKIHNFVLLTGYKSKKIKLYFKDGKKFGWNIKYSDGPLSWNTGKRIYEAKNILNNNFLLLYSDNYINFNLNSLFLEHFSNKNPITLTIVKKINGNISLNNNLKIKSYSPKKDKPNLNYVELGYMIVDKKKIFSDFFKTPAENSFNLTSILEFYSKKRKLGNLIIDNTYYSISDPKRLNLTANFLKRKKILLIDRDGIINEKAKKARYIERWKDFKFINDNIKALIYLSKKGFKFVVITNQAGVSQKILSKNQLYYIHQKMKNELIQKNVELVKIYYSPDHYNDHLSKTRKPAPGMFFLASKDLKLNLDNCLYVGDDIRDCKASYNAGFNSVFIGKKNNLKALNKIEYPIFTNENLLKSVKFIVSYYDKK